MYGVTFYDLHTALACKCLNIYGKCNNFHRIITEYVEQT